MPSSVDSQQKLLLIQLPVEVLDAIIDLLPTDTLLQLRQSRLANIADRILLLRKINQDPLLKKLYQLCSGNLLEMPMRFSEVLTPPDKYIQVSRLPAIPMERESDAKRGKSAFFVNGIRMATVIECQAIGIIGEAVTFEYYLWRVERDNYLRKLRKLYPFAGLKPSLFPVAIPQKRWVFQGCYQDLV